MQPFLLKVRKQKRPVATQRPSDADTLLCLRQRALPSLSRRRIDRGKDIRCVKPLVTQKTVRTSSPRIGPRLGQNVDDPARGPAELRNAAGGDDLELSNDLGTEERSSEVGCIVVSGKPINHETVCEVALTGDRDAGSRHR